MKNQIADLLSAPILILTLVSSNVALAYDSSETVVNDRSTDGVQNQDYENIIEILPEDFKPAFSRDTVIKPNGIVKRSWAAIESLDTLRNSTDNKNIIEKLNDSVENIYTEDQLAAIRLIEGYAESALVDMKDAVETLQASDEHYNVAVLAGMMMFVVDIEKEVNVFIEEILGQI